MTSRHERHQIVRNASNKKLRRNLKILAVVYVVLLLVTIVHIFITPLNWWQILVSITIGFSVGVVSSRMFRISWDEQQARVIVQIDLYGIVALALFIVFEIFRNNIAGLFATDGAVDSASFLLLTFAIYGRLIGTYRRVLAIARREFTSSSDK